MRTITTRIRALALWDKASIGLVLFALIIGFVTFQDYGLSWDYEPHDTYGRQVINFYKTFGSDRDAVGAPVAHHVVPMRNFGGGFEVFVNTLRYFLPGDYYEQRHLATFLFSLIGVIGTIFCARCVGGAQAGFFAGLFLLLYPVYYGHSFINHKDLPVAVTYIWVLATTIYSIDNRRLHPWRSILSIGVALGYLMSIRAGMFFAYGLLAIAWLLADLLAIQWQPKRVGELVRRCSSLLGALLAVVALSWIVMCALWPYAMVHPIEAPMAAIGKFSSFPWSLPMFFAGGYYLPSNAPWHYIPTWLLMQMPEYLIATLGLALWSAYSTIRKNNSWLFRFTSIKVFILLCAMLVPVAGIIVKKATIYDAVRHLLFLSPVLSVLAAFGSAHWFRSLAAANNPIRHYATSILVALLCFAAGNLASLHPYQYIFANHAFGGGTERASQRFESDYWATCTSEAVSWIFANYPSTPGRNTLISGWADKFQLKQPVEKLNPHRPDFVFSANAEEADLYITTGRFRGHVRRDRLVHVITRDGAKLCYIFALSKRRK